MTNEMAGVFGMILAKNAPTMRMTVENLYALQQLQLQTGLATTTPLTFASSSLLTFTGGFDLTRIGIEKQADRHSGLTQLVGPLLKVRLCSLAGVVQLPELLLHGSRGGIDQQLGLLLLSLPKLQGALAPVASERASAQLAAHERVREAARTKGRVSIQPVLPVDILGAYVLLWAGVYAAYRSGAHINPAMTLAFLAVSLAVVSWIFKTGYRLKA